MFEKFQQLTTAVKLTVILGGLSVVIGVILLIVLGIQSGTTGDKVAPEDTPRPASTETTEPEPAPTETKTEQEAIDDNIEAKVAELLADPRYTDEDKTAAYERAAEGYMAYCHILSTESNEQREARLKPYFVSTFNEYDKQYADILATTQECVLGSSVPVSITPEGDIVVGLSYEQARITDGEGHVGEKYGTATMTKENGIWVITEVTTSEVGPETGAV
jgi:hypothetical protein